MAKYIKEKIKLINQFKVRVTGDELKHMKGLKTEIAVDNYVRSLILNGLED